MKLTLSIFLVIFGCCHSTRAASDTENGSPLMWLLIRQLERTNDNFKKLEGQIQEMNTKVDSNGKHLEGLRNDIKNVKSEMSSVNTTFQSFLQSNNLQSSNYEKKFQTFDSKLGLLERHLTKLKYRLRCETGWKEWNGHCYYFSRETLTWAQSKQMCSRYSSHLVKIESSGENSMLVDEAFKSGDISYWIGATDIAKEGRWVWESDGTTLWYSNWGPGEPNDSSSVENCAHLFHVLKHKWNDASCGSKWNYICEKNIFT